MQRKEIQEELFDIEQPVNKTVILHGWSRVMLDCYKRGCVCNGCVYSTLESVKCKCKNAVMTLIREQGRPDIEEIEKILDDEESANNTNNL